jgi:DNA-directed RNA polymerase subunit H (RpoH/RPB5)
MTTTAETLNLYHVSRKNILDILSMRGFDVSGYFGASIHEVEIMANTEQLDMLVKSNNNEKKVYVKYNTKKTIRLQSINEYIDELFTGDDPVLTKKDDIIIIDASDPNDTTKKVLNDIWDNDGIYISVISIRSVMFNILKHQLVPNHRPLSADEKMEIDKLYNITSDSKYPDISRFSPVSAVIGLRPGQLCEIIRSSRTAVTSSYYRICSQ